MRGRRNLGQDMRTIKRSPSITGCARRVLIRTVRAFQARCGSVLLARYFTLDLHGLSVQGIELPQILLRQ